MATQVKEAKNGKLEVFKGATKIACVTIESSEPLTNNVKQKITNIISKIFQTLEDDISLSPLVLSFDAQDQDSRFVVKTTVKKVSYVNLL